MWIKYVTCINLDKYDKHNISKTKFYRRTYQYDSMYIWFKRMETCLKKHGNDKHKIMTMVTSGSKRGTIGVSAVVAMYLLIWVGRHVDIHFTAKFHNLHNNMNFYFNIWFKSSSGKKKIKSLSCLESHATSFKWCAPAHLWQHKFSQPQSLLFSLPGPSSVASL